MMQPQRPGGEGGVEGDDTADDDEYDIFESSLESLFGQHQPASGKPGAKYRLFLSDSLTLFYRIPTLQESSNNRLFAHYQWDAGRLLAQMIYASTEKKQEVGSPEEIEQTGIPSIAGSTVIELGAGTGLPALACANLGAQKVLITDYPDQGILDAISENIKSCGAEGMASVQGLDWAEQAGVGRILDSSGQPFDLILCADVLWLSTSHTHLLQAIVAFLAPSSLARTLVFSGFHTGRRALISFFRQASKQGLCPDWEAPHQGVFERNAIDGTIRPWSGALPFPKPGNDQKEAESHVTDNMDDYTERSKWLLFVSLRWESFREQT